MLRLAHQVGDHVLRVRVSVRDHRDLRGAGDRIDVHEPKHLPFRLRHVRIARPHNLVDLGHRLRAECHRGDRLCPAHPVHFVDIEEAGHGEDVRVHAAILARRRGQDHPLDPGLFRRNDGHVDRGHEAGGAAGDVDAYPLDRVELLTQHHPVAVPHPHGLDPRPAVKRRDVLDRALELEREFRVKELESAGDLRFGHSQLPGCQLHPVEPARVAQECLVAALVDVVDDLAHVLFEAALAHQLPVAQPLPLLTGRGNDFHSLFDVSILRSWSSAN